jgi:cation-transporting ATPase E
MEPPISLIADLPSLSEAEATRRRASGMGNTAPPSSGRSYGQIIRENVFTFINIVLLFLGVALAIVGRPGDAIMSTLIITLNVLVSVVQEIRAKRTLDQIALLTRPQATVVRDQIEQSLPADQLVIGDLLIIRPGDQIVVDGRLIGAGRIEVDESQLSGESEPISKHSGDPLYSGSFCVSGSACYTAERVGMDSLANQITAGARAFRRVLTPLQREIHVVIRISLVVVLYMEFLQMIMLSSGKSTWRLACKIPRLSPGWCQMACSFPFR